MTNKEELKPCPFCGSKDLRFGRVTFGHGACEDDNVRVVTAITRG